MCVGSRLQSYASKGLASPWPFRRSTAFMLGNEGTGLSPKQLAACDFLTHIPQYTSHIASLNVAVAGSIVLQHFALFAQFGVARRESQKFAVIHEGRLHRFQHPTDADHEEIELKRMDRARRKNEAAETETTAWSLSWPSEEAH
eukprot:gnl/MRDRNA2_/MRDRNA2_21501_c0_seq2.p2 gnl/MRDRNA2_/MRDRNA2_21501_c0~~gnl/MRDRNA2_/MRDRNA2_21501_c0_seq2.p2  ORF type:complete len:144 (+),score=21.90 gnl/MRDRNA2_/MRDRNA2_21501_c0_seq2:585-1016(+)